MNIIKLTLHFFCPIVILLATCILTTIVVSNKLKAKTIIQQYGPIYVNDHVHYSSSLNS